MRLRLVISSADDQLWVRPADSTRRVRLPSVHGHTFIVENKQSTLEEAFRLFIGDYECKPFNDYHCTYEVVDIPDEYMFQLALLGVHEMDFLVYNNVTKKMAICSAVHLAVEYTMATNSKGGYNQSSYRNSTATTNDVVFQWEYKSDEWKTKNDDVTVHTVLDSTYDNIYQYIEPNLMEWACRMYSNIADTLRPRVYGFKNWKSKIDTSDEPVAYEKSYPYYNFSDLHFLFNQYCNDEAMFLYAQDVISDSAIEILRELYCHCLFISTNIQVGKDYIKFCDERRSR